MANRPVKEFDDLYYGYVGAINTAVGRDDVAGVEELVAEYAEESGQEAEEPARTGLRQWLLGLVRAA